MFVYIITEVEPRRKGENYVGVALSLRGAEDIIREYYGDDIYKASNRDPFISDRFVYIYLSMEEESYKVIIRKEEVKENVYY